MRALPPLFAGILPAFATAVAAAGPGAAFPATLPGILASTAMVNFLIALTFVLLFVFGLYAYASLARFAPYHSWIYLYLASFSGIVWALFLMNYGGSLADAVFVITTVAGLNLIVHVLRFDRIEIYSPAGPASAVPSSG
ncbi:MAG: hypothetical protein LUQ67_05090 [Methanomicrobiales archaeon]|nr:hypothetical protein [Methanomicrobiales archaeon]